MGYEKPRAIAYRNKVVQSVIFCCTTSIELVYNFLRLIDIDNQFREDTVGGY